MVKPSILVTGATGGLGRVLVAELLARGNKVIATGRNQRIGALLEATGAQFVPADLAHDDLSPMMHDVTSVFHLAALSAPFGRTQDFISANITATERLMDASRKASCSRFIFTSTPSIYAQPQDQIAITEATALPVKLANGYAHTKLEAERAVLSNHCSSMACIALRPRAILSPCDTALLPRLLRAAEMGVMPLPYAGRALIEPTDARDVVEALLAAQAVAPEAGGRAYNISSGTAVYLRDLLTHLFQHLGKNVHLLPVPRRALLAVGTLLEHLSIASRTSEPPITAYGALILGWSQTFDLTAARTALGWIPRHHPFDSIQWALSERPLCDKS